jgi:hypothetical protein
VVEISKLNLPPHPPQPLQVSSKTGSNKGHFTLDAVTIFRHYLATHFRVVVQIPKFTHTPHTPQPVHVWSKLVSNKGHFSLEAETVFRHNLVLRCRVLVQMSNLTTPSHVPQPLQFVSKSGSYKGHYTLEAQKSFFVTISPLIGGWWFKSETLPTFHIVHNHCKSGPIPTVTKGTLLLRPIEFVTP